MRDKNGVVRAAVAVHAPRAGLSVEQAVANLPVLNAAAKRMGKLL